MLRTLTRTPDDFVLTIIRVVLGVVILPHGLQKLFGWFGGGGVAGTQQYLESLGLPGFLVYLMILAEVGGGLALIVGFLGRLGALGIALVLLGAVFTVHIDVGFWMNWTGQQQGEGYEYHLLALAMCTVVVLRGSGALSVDRALAGADPSPYTSRPAV
jgi:putative oxidoreductase